MIERESGRMSKPASDKEKEERWWDAGEKGEKVINIWKGNKNFYQETTRDFLKSRRDDLYEDEKLTGDAECAIERS